ncbi:MAG: glycosyltransferase family 39 protein, partial [Candidatus Omnitrophota bacterium]
MPGITDKIDLRNKLIIAILIIAAAVIIRLYNVNGAMFDFNPLRQALNASVARNYAQNPGTMFLLPQSINVGPAPGYLMFEFPILPYVVSFLVKAAGVQNWVFRVPSVIFFAFSAIYFYKVCMEIIDPRISLLALIFYCITPMTILMGRVFQSESFMILALMFALYYFLRWIRSEKRRYLLLYTLGLTFFVLLKIPNLYIFLFFTVLFLVYKKPRLALYLIVSSIFVIAVNIWWWFIYSSEVRSLFPTQYTMVGGNVPVFSLHH